MKCPKCGYVSFEYLDTCNKCQSDLTTFKEERGLFAIKPGFIDLAMTLSESDDETSTEESLPVVGVSEATENAEVVVPTHALPDEDLADLPLTKEEHLEGEEEETVPTVTLDEEEDFSIDLTQLEAEEEEPLPAAPITEQEEAHHVIGLGELADLSQDVETPPQEAQPSESPPRPTGEESDHVIDFAALEEREVEMPEQEESSSQPTTEEQFLDFPMREETSTAEEITPEEEHEIPIIDLSDLEEETIEESTDLEEIDFDLDVDWEDEDEEKRE